MDITDLKSKRHFVANYLIKWKYLPITNMYFSLFLFSCSHWSLLCDAVTLLRQVRSSFCLFACSSVPCCFLSNALVLDPAECEFLSNTGSLSTEAHICVPDGGLSTESGCCEMNPKMCACAVCAYTLTHLYVQLCVSAACVCTWVGVMSLA